MLRRLRKRNFEDFNFENGLDIRDAVGLPIMKEVLPNENPDTVTTELIEKKYSIGF